MSRNLKVSLAVVFVFCLTLTVVFVVSRAGGTGKAEQSAAPVRADSQRLSAPSDSKATFVEFLDFECEACGAMYPTVERLRQTYGDQVTFVVRYFPLPGHFNGDRAARAAAAAAQQGRFEAMYKKLFETQQQWGEQQEPLDELFSSYAQELGLNMEQYAVDYNSKATRELIDRDIADGKARGVSATPTLYINHTAVEPGSYEELSSALTSAMAK
ncbi:thioredoxin domain-containing protein [Williamsia sp. 1135]|uniref:DsbA family protein n=1 Tax=Williamsia sp. 1135 TaxID=1889262 RepID=UPI000A122FA7|nr:thioredoxin domain-containing protein [Williamsia sp. 1135]ORM37205.1 thioredoxin [Williamsia sp. 1135]